MEKRKKRLWIWGIVVILLAVSVWVLWENTALERNDYVVASKQLPASFSGFQIAHISDLHNGKMQRENEKVLTILRQTQPDVIAITGDLIDSRRTDVDTALAFVREAVQIAPCYYVTGNHEARVEEYTLLADGLLELGVTVLENSSLEVHRDGESIVIAGVEDPSFQAEYLMKEEYSALKESLETLNLQKDRFTVLLSHRPEYFDLYAQMGVHLVLSGHSHGGQFRIPVIGGLFAPGQGLFPQYDAGLFVKGNTNMVVSRGIGNSAFPVRVNNRPEVIIVTLLAG